MRQTKPALFLRFWFPEYYEDFKLPAEAANDASPACAKAPGNGALARLPPIASATGEELGPRKRLFS